MMRPLSPVRSTDAVSDRTREGEGSCVSLLTRAGQWSHCAPNVQRRSAQLEENDASRDPRQARRDDQRPEQQVGVIQVQQRPSAHAPPNGAVMDSIRDRPRAHSFHTMRGSRPFRTCSESL